MILLVLLHPSWIEQTCGWLQAIPILFLPGGEVMIVGDSCKVKMKNSMSARIQLNEGLTALRRPSRGHRSAAFNGQAWLHHGCNVTSHCGSDGGSRHACESCANILLQHVRAVFWNLFKLLRQDVKTVFMSWVLNMEGPQVDLVVWTALAFTFDPCNYENWNVSRLSINPNALCF